MTKYCLILLNFLICAVAHINAQCISTFPHIETFESAPVWTSGGNNSDWAWGTPSKATITGAGGGLKSWCVAGLNGSSYNNSEQSFIKSPCYNFSTLTYPVVSFKVFWESEWLYDGASLQYSINNGVTWNTVGAFGDPINCMTQNWYNRSSITYLTWISPTNKNGWAGNIQSTAGSCQGGNGSNGWVTAKHCLNGLAGQSNVMFRFTFGSGSACNDFDGFAIDDFTIENAPANAPAFTYTCNAFTAINPLCPIPTNYTWNFGDPNSGSANTSTVMNPIHNFSSAGIYTVSLTTSGGPCNAPGTITQTVTVLGLSVTATSSVSCNNGNDGSATLTGIYGTPAYSYTWLPSGGNSNTSNGLSSGNYTITVKDVKGCVNNNTVFIAQPTAITLNVSKTNVSCFAGNDGSINLSVNGGEAPYTYTWLPTNSTTNNQIDLTANNYTCYINDSKMCSIFTTVTITQPSVGLSATISSSPSCMVPSGKASVIASGGTPIYSYTWFPNGGNNNSANNLSSGTYSVTISDSQFCLYTAVTTISTSVGPTIILTATNVLCFNGTNGSSEATASGSIGPYTYIWSPVGGNNAIANNLVAGTYSCLVTDANNCASINTISITQGQPIIVSAPNHSACPNVHTVILASATGGEGGPYQYSWNIGGVNTPSINVYSNSSLNYSVIATDVNGCPSLPTQTQLYIYQTLHADFSASEYELPVTDPLVYFIDNSSGNPVSWQWNYSSLSSSTTQSTSYHFPTDGNYDIKLTIEDKNGCKDSISKQIKVIPEFTFYSPNSFTPDFNLTNDTFIPKGTGWIESTFQLWIFDRWGSLVFHSTDSNMGWDGTIKNTLAKDDVYIWKAEVTDSQKKQHQYVGHLSLIR